MHRVTPSDRYCHLVVLHLKADGAARHGDFHTSQEGHSDLIPARLSSRFHVLALVDRRQMGRRRNVCVQFVEYLSISIYISNVPHLP